MKIDYKEAFEKSRIAGSIAAGALDEVAKIIKPGITTNEIDKVCYEFINDNDATLLRCFIGVFLNLVALQVIMLSVMEFHPIKF